MEGLELREAAVFWAQGFSEEHEVVSAGTLGFAQLARRWGEGSVCGRQGAQLVQPVVLPVPLHEREDGVLLFGRRGRQSLER